MAEIACVGDSFAKTPVYLARLAVDTRTAEVASAAAAGDVAENGPGDAATEAARELH
jgi:hypothetical protein